MPDKDYMQPWIQSILEGVQRLTNASDSELRDETIKSLDRYVWSLPYVWDDSNSDSEF